MRYAKLLICLLVTLSGCVTCGPPQTRQAPVVNVYHDIEVVDEYQWLENWQDRRVQSWSNRQNAYARSVLDRLPHVDELRERITEILARRHTLCPETAATAPAAALGGYGLGRGRRIGTGNR